MRRKKGKREREGNFHFRRDDQRSGRESGRLRHSGLRKQQVTDSTNRAAVFLRRRPDERNNSSLKRLIAAGLELLSLPARGSASGKNEERARNGENERSSGKGRRTRRRRRGGGGGGGG